MEKIILASSSPRRIEILRNLKLDFEVFPSEYEEVFQDIAPEELVCKFAKHKALDVRTRAGKGKIIIAADTVVCIDSKVLGKPASDDEAYAMLKSLSGRKHNVLTGICVISGKTDAIHLDFEVTDVYIKDLSDEEIWQYIKTGEPKDKAGAYGIQGFGGLFVKRIEGCYFNVVGLPIFKLYSILGKMGVNLLVKEVQNGG